MNQIATRLAQLLEIEGKAYTKLHGVLREEREALVHWSIGELREIVQEKNRLVKKLRQLEEKRNDYITSIQDDLVKMGLASIPAEATITLSDIMEMLDEQDALALSRIQKHLATIVKDVTTTNHNNQVLLKRSLEIVNANLSIYAQSEKLANTYNSSGKIRSKREHKLIDGAI